MMMIGRSADDRSGDVSILARGFSSFLPAPPKSGHLKNNFGMSRHPRMLGQVVTAMAVCDHEVSAFRTFTSVPASYAPAVYRRVR